MLKYSLIAVALTVSLVGCSSTGTDAQRTSETIQQFNQNELVNSLRLPGLEALGVAAFDHVEACFDNAKTLVETLQACTTIAELDAVDITVGWP